MTANTAETAPVGMEGRIGAAYQAAFVGMSADRARDPLTLTLSGLGRCTRRAAYQIAGTPASDVHPADEQRAANLGTILHDRLVPLLARQLGGLAEQPVVLKAAGLEINGRYDVWDAPEAGVIDVKTVGENRLATVRRFGAFSEHRVQGFGYALSLYQTGIPVKSVNLLYLDRSRGDYEVVSMPFTRGHALRVIDRVAEIKFHANDPDNAPRDPDGRRKRVGPGWSYACDDCPFLRRCWGPDAKPRDRNVEAQRPVTQQEVEAICAALVRARDVGAEADKDVDFYRGRLSAVKPGVYGAYAVTRSGGHERPDQRGMQEALESNGIAVPLMRTAQTTSVSVVKATPGAKTPTQEEQ